MEKIKKPLSGYLALLIALASLATGIFCAANIPNGKIFIAGAIFFFILFIFLIKGLMIIQPNHSRVLNFFGKYVYTIKDNGLFFVNPLYASYKISLRGQNLQGQILKVNDKMGNPIEIAAVIVSQVGDTYKADYEVANYDEYV